MTTPTVLPRPLPRSLVPVPYETLSGYLLSLAHRLEQRPSDLAHRLGLERWATGRTIDVGFAIMLPAGTATRFGHACNLAPGEVTDLTLARWDGLLFDTRTLGKAARTVQGNG